VSHWDEFAAALLGYAFTAAAAGAVFIPLYYFWAPSRRLLPLQRFRSGTWSGLEVWLAFLLYVMVSGAATDLLNRIGFYEALFDKPPSIARKDLWASPLAGLLFLALLFGMFFRISRTRPSHLGFTRARWIQNSFLGYLGFLLLTPVVFGTYALVLSLLGISPQDHVFKKLIQESPGIADWTLIVSQAVFWAPILEETLFRGVLQGWLRRGSFFGHVVVMLGTLAWGLLVFVDSLSSPADQPAKEINAGPLIFAGIMALVYGCGLLWVWSPVLREGRRYFLPAESTPAAPSGKESETAFSTTLLTNPRLVVAAVNSLARQRWGQWRKNNALLAIFGSAMLWAAHHSAVWPSPVPLLLLGIGLGYLAYRTQSLLPGIIVHSLFNTVASIVLVMQA
jgi:membrane protease YdiL (CAAX protease family)